MRRTLLRHYTLLFYEDEEELSKFLEKQTKASESIKYVMSKIYEQIGDEDLFEYLANDDLNINITAINKSLKLKKTPSTKPKKKTNKPKKKEIDLSDESLNADLSVWAQTGKSF